MNTQAETLIAAAEGFIGTKENPKNSNNVIFNTHYYGREVGGGDYAWCAVFVWDCFRLADLSGLFYGGKKTASCEQVLGYAESNGQFVAAKELRRGDIVLYKFPANGRRANHIGIVVSADASRVTAIEGNTSLGSDSDGGEVMKRERALTRVVGGYRPKYGKDEKMTDEEFAQYMARYMNTAGTGGGHSAWADEAVAALTADGIVSGDGTGDCGWRKPITKETAAQMIYNLMRAHDNERSK